jgi:hypothetical protein
MILEKVMKIKLLNQFRMILIILSIFSNVMAVDIPFKSNSIHTFTYKKLIDLGIGWNFRTFQYRLFDHRIGMEKINYRTDKIPDDFPFFIQGKIMSPEKLTTLYASIGTSSGIQKTEKTNSPPRLIGIASFQDANKNGVLEPGETGIVSLYIRNEGDGSAEKIEILNHISNPLFKEKIHIEQINPIKKIKPWKDNRQQIPISASISLPKGKFNLAFAGRDKSGNILPVMRIAIFTSDTVIKKIEQPEIKENFIDKQPETKEIPTMENISEPEISEVLTPTILRVFSANEYTVDLGSSYGIKEGQLLDVFIPGEESIHPATGMVLSTREEILIGQLRIIKVNETYSNAKLVRLLGERSIQIGDRIRMAQGK